MVSKKQQTTKEISLCQVMIKLDSIALDSHPIDEKIGIKTAKRTIKLAYIQDGGVIRVPVQKWIYGWLKELFKSKARGTVVHLPDKMDTFPIGTAENLLVGKSAEEWDITGDHNVPYALGEELVSYNLWPFHDYVAVGTGARSSSIIKYYYKINDKSKEIPLEIYTLLPPNTVVNNLQSLGKIYGIGPKAGGSRLGTFEIVDHKISNVGEIYL